MTNVGYPGGGTWMLQNRAHAHFNNVYIVAPNVGPVYLHPKMRHPMDIAGGQSHIVDYNVVSYSTSGYNTFVSGIVDIEALRQFRVMNLNSNWMKDLRTEVFRRMYEEPIHPKNLLAAPGPVVARGGRRDLPAEHRLVRRGSFTPPANAFEGAKFFPMDPDLSPAQAWKEARQLWDEGPDGPSGPDGGSGGPMPEGGYDVVIVGGGHNGLACGGYLAKAGQRVLVLEARDVVGGGCATKEVAAPGFRHNFHSNFHGSSTWACLPGPRPRALRRCSTRVREPVRLGVFPDGRRSCARATSTRRSRIARFSKRDADTFREVAQV